MSSRSPYHALTVQDLVQEAGPLLPYTVLLGQPVEPDEHGTFPYWTNLLQKGLPGFACWAEDLRTASWGAASVLESMTHTTQPEYLRIWVIKAGGSAGAPEGDMAAYWEQVATHPVQGLQKVEDLLLERRSQGLRGPQHHVVLLLGLGSRVGDREVHRRVLHLLRQGPIHGVWPFVVDTYAHHRTWRKKAGSFRPLALYHFTLRPPRSVPGPVRKRFRGGREGEWVLLSQGEARWVWIPQPTWLWEGAFGVSVWGWCP